LKGDFEDAVFFSLSAPHIGNNESEWHGQWRGLASFNLKTSPSHCIY